MEELDVQPVLVESSERRDSVALLEAQHELLRRVVGGLELVEPSTLLRRSNSVPCRSMSSQPGRGVTQSSRVAARTARSSSTSTSTSMTTPSCSPGVGRGLT
jgi:hypothetical protein